LNENRSIQTGGQAHQRPALTTTYVEPDGEMEQIVARVWQEVLGLERIGVHDNFFELGGNSLLGLSVVSRLKKALGQDVPAVALFEGPTVRRLTAVLSRKGAEQPAYDKSRTRGEERRAKRRKSRTP
jgi:hypothetical protein